jgi:FkbM family methyltransferase
MNRASLTLTAGPASRPFVYRPGGSDEPVIQSIFQAGAYELRDRERGNGLRAYGATQRALGKTPLIVDAGANIGASAVFFALTHPGAAVVAIEPEPENFSLLQENVAGLPVACLRAALASVEGHVALSDPGIGAWGHRTGAPAPGAGPVPTVTMNALYAAYAATHVPYIAKIDIEGAEADLFSRNLDWVAQTPMIIIELHDWLLPRQGSSRHFLRCIAEQDRDLMVLGENLVSIRNDL